MKNDLNSKIGNYGESIVLDFLKRNGTHYWVGNENNYNMTDIIINKDGKLIFMEVNTKKRYIRNGISYTGKNTVQLDRYRSRSLNYGVRYYLVFVDYEVGECYGEYLDALDSTEFKEINYNGTGITMYKVSDMKLIFRLNPQHISVLSEMQVSNKQLKLV